MSQTEASKEANHLNMSWKFFEVLIMLCKKKTTNSFIYESLYCVILYDIPQSMLMKICIEKSEKISTVCIYHNYEVRSIYNFWGGKTPAKVLLTTESSIFCNISYISKILSQQVKHWRLALDFLTAYLYILWRSQWEFLRYLIFLLCYFSSINYLPRTISSAMINLYGDVKQFVSYSSGLIREIRCKVKGHWLRAN